MTMDNNTKSSQKRLLDFNFTSWKLKRYIKHLFIGIFASVLIIILALPVNALQAEVTPSNPQLGDTLSVVINVNNPDNNSNPMVFVGEDSYPVFAMAPNKYRALIPTTPLNKPGTMAIKVSVPGQVRNLAVNLRNRSFPTQRINLPPRSAGVKATQHELQRVAAFKQLQTAQKYWNGPFLQPNKGSITTIYGVRRYYNGKFANDYYHRGVDYASPQGSPVVAPAAGTVALVGTVSEGFRVHGNTVGIDHGQGVTSILLHLNTIKVKEGDFVKPNQLIGTVGSTGASTGPHLHWGLYVNGQSVDPVPWRFDGVD
ncbi:M23 family metallopeptidase [Umezakia ovalisporum]|jgi:lysostaphin|uniref:M23 family metallopeptidase n=1 Tax=Umezakia ovalisporum FSS-62 TaxID=2971776 RepID=A0AA43KGH6_9CYAN|nr:M23 family metallopeptidase [Umezakia ovalisporum]MDH6065010.1 M23 family metallopeptidase [Umezakia ovalisporum FSS-62]MDH6087895.1 M23 family metallopeptidase [Umezakia ovalisporum Ak1311]CEJ45707.1 Metalloendopeptidase-like Membrane proteins (Unch aracterized protein) [Umezakia ovalisporum]